MKKRKKSKKRAAPSRKSRKKAIAASPAPTVPAAEAVEQGPIDSTDAGSPPAGDALARAAGALQAGRPADAFGFCRQVLAAEPDNADALNLAGVAAFQTGDGAEARSLLETAVAFKPGFADAFNNLGNVLKAEGALGDAEAAYKKALKARPGYVDAEYNLGITQEAQGRFSDAEASYRRCLDLDPGFAPGHFNLGNVMKALSRMDDALSAYRRALDLRPGYAEALNNLGTVEMELGHGADAIHAYRQAVGADPGFADAHYNLGIALQEGGQLDDAIECYEKTLECDPAHAGARINIGYALKEMGKLDEAAAAYEQAIDMAPDYDKAQANLGDVYLQQGNARAAVDLCDGFLEDHPGNISILAFKAIALEELGDQDGVRELYDFDRLIRPVTLSPPDGFADIKAFNGALAEHVLGHPSLVYAPKSHATRLGRHSGELLAEPKGPVAALEHAIVEAVEGYRKAVKPDPDHPWLASRPEKTGLNVWGVAMDSQGYQVAHNHPSAWLSGVYYLKVPDVIGDGDPVHAGWIEFGRAPDNFHVPRDPQVRLIKPVEGLMILFPSYFYHRTIPFEAEELRISIAFDVLARE